AAAALRVGAGLVTLAAPQSLNPILESRLIEAMTCPVADQGEGRWAPGAFDTIQQAAADKRCIALGPGMGMGPAGHDLVLRMVRELEQPMVIDADGLNHLAGHLDEIAARRAPTVLTPHPGEMARLIDRTVPDIQQDRLSAVRHLSRLSRAHVILKGARTLVADPEGTVWINPTGNAGMASGGMGDVLTGAVAGLLTQGVPPTLAAAGAVFIHGLAADLLAAKAPWGYLATEVMDALPLAIQRVLQDPPAPPVGTPLL
ncbi:MAG: NAD(P)H-hydrate dehydratase, partial [Desulfatitalea sp.]|nr:NAD(P)H-hydrate dehydratase [Desulfatitalea sp.]